ncbi:hypothetical protein V5O48_007976 [Marasmius crinis-equi]|uniref:DUF6532 domain-containing protein n=1 Tax=Marasmius crinis-equi TaxID=585013 RepID=A0ABR3FFC3_9AGAR
MSLSRAPKVCLVSVTSEYLDIEISPTGEECRNEGSRPLMTITLDAAQVADAFLIRLQFPNAMFKPLDKNNPEIQCSPAQLSEYSTTEPEPIRELPLHILRSPAADSVTESDNSPLFKSWESRGREKLQSPVQPDYSSTESDISPWYRRDTVKMTVGDSAPFHQPRPKVFVSRRRKFSSPGDPVKQALLSESGLQWQAQLTPEKNVRVRKVIPMKRSAINPEYRDHVEESQEEEVEVSLAMASSTPRVRKASAKVTDPNNAASTSSKKTASTKGKGKAPVKNTPAKTPQFTQKQLQDIMMKIAASGTLDAALIAGASQSSNTVAQPSNTVTSVGTKRKAVTNELRTAPVKKKAKKSVVESDEEQEEDDEEEEDPLKNVLADDIQIFDDDDDDEEEDEEDEEREQPEEDDDEDGEEDGGEDVVMGGNPPNANNEDLVEKLAELDTASLQNLATTWAMMEDDIRASNGIEEVEPTQIASVWVPPSTPSRSTSTSAAAAAVLPSRAPPMLRINRNGNSTHKLAISNFTPRTQRLINVTRPAIRKSTALEHAFPDIERLEFIKRVAEEALTRFGDGKDVMTGTLTRVLGDPALAEPFLTYNMYARGGLLSTITTKTRACIAGHYGIPGAYDLKTIVRKIEWLLQQGNFKMGALDIANEYCDRQQPYQNEIYATLIRTIFFSKGRADAAVFRELTVNQRIPGPLFALLSTAIEHALTLWSGGAERKGEFGEASKDRYHFHLQSWQYMEKEAPTHAANLSKRLFKTVAEQTNKTFLIEEAVGELSGVDMANLEAMAKAEELLDAPTTAAPAATVAPNASVPPAPSSNLDKASDSAVGSSSTAAPTAGSTAVVSTPATGIAPSGPGVPAAAAATA